MSDGPLNVAVDGLLVAIRLSPRTRTDRLVAVAPSAAGGHVLKATVTAPVEADPQRVVEQVAPEIARLPGG